MERFRILLAACLLALGSGCGRTVPSDGIVDIVPVPVRVTPAQGVFRLGASTRVCIDSPDERMRCVAGVLDDVLQPIFGRGLECLLPAAGEKGTAKGKADIIPIRRICIGGGKIRAFRGGNGFLGRI